MWATKGRMNGQGMRKKQILVLTILAFNKIIVWIRLILVEKLLLTSFKQTITDIILAVSGIELLIGVLQLNIK